VGSSAGPFCEVFFSGRRSGMCIVAGGTYAPSNILAYRDRRQFSHFEGQGMVGPVFVLRKRERLTVGQL
jgi:hypothetical protein